jgi:hypothetical protein
MADNQKAKHGDSQSGQKNDQEKSKDQRRPREQRQGDGNKDSRFGQGGKGDQKQASQAKG